MMEQMDNPYPQSDPPPHFLRKFLHPEEETLIFYLHRHPILFVPIAAVIAFLFFVPIIVYLGLRDSSLNILSRLSWERWFLILFFYYFIIGILSFRAFVDYYFDLAIITTKRIIDVDQLGFFTQTVSEAELDQIQDVTARQSGFWQTIFDFGDVSVQTAAEKPRFIFEAVPHPYKVSRQILSVCQEAIRRNKLPPPLGSDDFKKENGFQDAQFKELPPLK